MSWDDIPKQRFFVDFSNPDSKVAGDCWRCCIAAVTNRPPEEVPHFLQLEIDARENRCWADCDQMTQHWLNERGYVLIRLTGGWLSFNYAEDAQKTPVIKCGPTPRSRKMHQHHAVVFLGDKMVYDPHPDGTGLTAVCNQYLVVPCKPKSSS